MILSCVSITGGERTAGFGCVAVVPWVHNMGSRRPAWQNSRSTMAAITQHADAIMQCVAELSKPSLGS